MRRLAFLACVLYAPAASAQNVLLIADDDAAGSGVLAGALKNAGMAVTQTAIPSWQYTGANPPPAGFDVIVLLAGTTQSRSNDMPQSGQSAILSFVNGGGGLVETEWAAFQVASGHWQTMAPLVLLQRMGGTIGLIDYKVDPAFQTHPLWANLPASFSVSMASNVGAVIPGPGVVRIATSVAAGDAVAVRDLINNGRIVDLSTAGDYTNGLWSSATMQTLAVNAAKWASKSRVNAPPVADPGGPYTVPEGGSIKLTGKCNDPDMDAQIYAWDFQGNGLFQDAMGPNPVFSAAALDGPQAITIGLKCTDSGGLSSTMTTQVTVTNVAPVINSMPPTTAMEGSLYEYDAIVADPGPHDVLTCTLKAAPMGMTVTANGCKVLWTPTYDQARTGSQSVTLVVTDKPGATAMQTWTIATAFIDKDMDGLPDTWELMYFGNLMQGPGDDPDKDGRPNLKEYLDGTDPTKYDGPNAPAIVSPDGGVHAPTAPMLTVSNATSPTKDPLVYEFQVYSDAQLQNLVDVDISVLEGQNNQTTYSPPKLMEDRHYWWRARARDPYVSGPWSGVATFFADDVHEPPTAPHLLMPLDQSKIKSSRPMLQIQNAKSSDELQLTYRYEIYADAALTMPVESMSGVPQGGMGTTSYQVRADLTPYSHYWWRVRATDSGAMDGKMLDGPWSDVGTFQIVPINTPPSPPIISAPTEGQRVGKNPPAIVVGGSVDPEDEAIVYICELDVGVDFDTANKQASGDLQPDMNNQSTWTPQRLMEDQHYCVRCRAQATSQTSGWTQTCFLIDERNDPPTVPVLQNPADMGMAAGDVVRFTWVNSIDPEGDAIRYDIEVFADAALTMRVARGQGEDGPTGITLVGIPAGSLWWRARAVDNLGAASDWSKPNAFTDGALPLGGGGGTSGANGCSCRVTRRTPATYNGVLCFIVGMAMAISLGRRRRRRGADSR